jgi:tetratricopeptide (TPR) repeat protein
MKSEITRTREIFIVLTICSLAGHAVAGDSTLAAERSDEAFAEAEQEHYETALRLFQESYQLQPAPKTLFNIGMMQKALKRNREAVKTFRQVLALPIDDGMRKDTESAILEMKDTVGYLRIISKLDGVEVFVDGEAYGTTPLTEDLVLLTGIQEVLCKKKGFEPWSTQVEIPGNGTVPLKVNLEVEKGSIELSCDLNAFVRLNNEVAGACPFTQRVVPGTYEVMVSADGKVPSVQTVNVASGKTVSLEIALADLPLPAPTPSPAPPAPTPATQFQPPKRTPAFLISGVTSMLAGLAGVGVGILFTVRSQNDYDDVVDLIDNANQAAEDKDEAAYNLYVSQYQTAKEKWENDKHPADRAGIIAGYVAGGVLTLTGAVLLGIHAKKKTSEKISIAPTVSGLTVSF